MNEKQAGLHILWRNKNNGADRMPEQQKTVFYRIQSGNMTVNIQFAEGGPELEELLCAYFAGLKENPCSFTENCRGGEKG